MSWRIDVQVRAKDREGHTKDREGKPYFTSSPFDANPRRGKLRRLQLTESGYALFVLGTRFPEGPLQILRQRIPELRPEDVSADVIIWKTFPDGIEIGKPYNRILNPFLQRAMEKQISKTLSAPQR